MIIASIVIAVILLFFIWAGAPYVPTHSRDIDKLFNELPRGNNQTFIDCGAGDGRVLIAASKHGYRAVGYELNPIIFAIGAWYCRNQPNATVKLGLWQFANLTQFDVIYMFGSKQNVQRIINIRPTGLIVSYGFGPQSPTKYKKNINPFWIFRL